MHVYSDPATERHVNDLAGVESPKRLPAALAGVERAEHSGVLVERRPCSPAEREALTAVHDPPYLDDLQEMSAAGGGYLSLDTAVGAGSWEAALLASGAACSALESVLAGETAFAVARPPGHHAGRDYGMGFCLTNHAAVAAGLALSRGLEESPSWTGTCTTATVPRISSTVTVGYSTSRCIRVHSTLGRARQVRWGKEKGLA